MITAYKLKQEHGITVLLVERDGIRAEKPGPDTVFKPNDRLTVFGKYKEISQVFQARERFS